jgi:hypothetical protein
VLCDKITRNVIEYWMPSKLYNLLKEEPSELLWKIIGLRIKAKYLKENSIIGSKDGKKA